MRTWTVPPARAAVPLLLPVLQGTRFERNGAAAAKAYKAVTGQDPPAP